MKRIKLFSERNGYTHPSDVIITRKVTPEVENGMCTCVDILRGNIHVNSIWGIIGYNYDDLSKYIWLHYLHNRLADYDYRGHGYDDVIIALLRSRDWYDKLDVMEICISYLFAQAESQTSFDIAKNFVSTLNSYFEELNFGYRVIDYLIVEVDDDAEVKTIENAIADSDSNVQLHLHTALEKLAERPEADYRNSIKESISAVEAFCRILTNEDSFRNALSSLEKRGLKIPSSLKSAFNVMYGYTNAADTGIRHPLVTDSDKFVPSSEEATFMLVVCSAFINYLKKKVAKL